MRVAGPATFLQGQLAFLFLLPNLIQQLARRDSWWSSLFQCDLQALQPAILVLQVPALIPLCPAAGRVLPPALQRISSLESPLKRDCVAAGPVGGPQGQAVGTSIMALCPAFCSVVTAGVEPNPLVHRAGPAPLENRCLSSSTLGSCLSCTRHSGRPRAGREQAGQGALSAATLPRWALQEVCRTGRDNCLLTGEAAEAREAEGSA